MSTLVTGGCGFIGSHIVEALVARDESVRILDNLSTGHESNIATFRDKAELVRGDIRDTDAVATAMQGVTHVFHEAALVSVADSVERPEENHAINITGTLNVLDAARKAGVRRVVWASSAAIYGDDPALPKREDMLPAPVSPYGMAKLAGEHYASVFAHCYGIETVSLRYFNVYGPRQDPSSMYSGVIAKFTDVLKAGGTPVVFGDGLQTRDFIYVKDIVAANLLAMDTPGAAGVFNIGTGNRVSLLELLEVLGDLAVNRSAPEFQDPRLGDIEDSVADVSRARDILGFTASHDIRKGLSEFLAFQKPGDR